ncbi:hypothetical protein RI129_012618 [Pyrocoelia pectoralis]|uniref:C2H2-type domain-containing protein n=1 Tax=Pyrocoelia pectoralis TaxID=417401 RepID=A0AAN7UZQ9_9COLE
MVRKHTTTITRFSRINQHWYNQALFQTLDIVLEPLICNGCKESLSIAFSFKKQCIETEKTLFGYIQRRRHNENCTDLLNSYDLLTLAKNDVILEHNYSTYKKQDCYIHSIGNDSPADLQAFIKATLSSLTEVTKQKNDSPYSCDDDVIGNVVNHETVHGYQVDLGSAAANDSIEKDASGSGKKVNCFRSLRSKTIPNILRRNYFTRQRPLVVRKVTEENKENVSKRRFRCTKCNKGVDCKCNFNSRKELYSCPTCGRSFSQEKNLESHQLTHGRRNTFQCSSCKRFLVSQSSLVRHLKVHAVEHQRTKAFPRRTSRPYATKSHTVDHVPTHMDERPYECRKCHKRFSKSHTLRIHEQTHDDNPYQCHGCKRFFRDLSTYRKHVSKFLAKCVAGRRLYRTERNFKPKFQSKVLEDINEINREIAADNLANRMKLRRLKYFCKVCNKGFTTNFSRNRHVKFQHWLQ